MSAGIAKRALDILRAVAPDLRDVFVLGGLAATTYGVSQVSVPAAWIVCGAGLFWLGIRRT